MKIKYIWQNELIVSVGYALRFLRAWRRGPDFVIEYLTWRRADKARLLTDRAKDKADWAWACATPCTMAEAEFLRDRAMALAVETERLSQLAEVARVTALDRPKSGLGLVAANEIDCSLFVRRWIALRRWIAFHYWYCWWAGRHE